MIERPSDSGAQHSILVVEDDPTMTDLLRVVLEDSGYHIVTAYDGEEALRLARERVPDLITLDLGLPGRMDGREFLRRLRHDPATQGVPVIVVTGMWYDPSREDKVEAVLGKPFDVAELEDTVRRVLSLPGSRRSG